MPSDSGISVPIFLEICSTSPNEGWTANAEGSIRESRTAKPFGRLKKHPIIDGLIPKQWSNLDLESFCAPYVALTCAAKAFGKKYPAMPHHDNVPMVGRFEGMRTCFRSTHRVQMDRN